MRDHSMCGEFFDFHSRGPFPGHFGPHGCRPHGCRPPSCRPHGHGPWARGACRGAFRHGPHDPHHHKPRGWHGHHREFDFFGPRGFNPWDRFRHFGRFERPDHFDRPAPGFFGRGDVSNRRAESGCRRRHGKGKDSEEQTFVIRGVVIEQDKRPNSV